MMGLLTATKLIFSNEIFLAYPVPPYPTSEVVRDTRKFAKHNKREKLCAHSSAQISRGVGLTVGLWDTEQSVSNMFSVCADVGLILSKLSCQSQVQLTYLPSLDPDSIHGSFECTVPHMDFFNCVVPSTTQGPNAESKKLFYSYFRTWRTVKWEHRYLTKQKIEHKENILLLLKDFENCEAKI